MLRGFPWRFLPSRHNKTERIPFEPLRNVSVGGVGSLYIVSGELAGEWFLTKSIENVNYDIAFLGAGDWATNTCSEAAHAAETKTVKVKSDSRVLSNCRVNPTTGKAVGAMEIIPGSVEAILVFRPLPRPRPVSLSHRPCLDLILANPRLLPITRIFRHI